MDKEFWKEELAEVNDHIMHDCVNVESKWFCRYYKGMIVADDKAGKVLDFVKASLNYDKLKVVGKVRELTIDESWTPLFDEIAGNALRNKLVSATYDTNHGLLVLNVTNIKLFNQCWLLKQLAKQEVKLDCPLLNDSDIPSDFKYDGYVLINIIGIKWNDAFDYARKENSGQFEAMMQFYRRIK